MDLSFSEKDFMFREEVREFIRTEYPGDLRRKMKQGKEFAKEDFLCWQRVLYNKGWAAPSWPVEYGGTGWSATQRYIFQEELGQAATLNILPFGLKMLAPVLMAYGSDYQKGYFLPRILTGQDWWCQGYSEPGAGSDLASLRTSAVKDGDEYVVNGSKTWTSFAQWADWIFCLVRTNSMVKKQAGISFLLIDMKTPGITVRPIITIDGMHEVNEVFFDNVRVPIKNRVGEENMGWTYAKTLLSHERTGTAEVPRSKYGITSLKKNARKHISNGKSLLEDEYLSNKLAQLEIDLLALEYSDLRVLSDDFLGKKGTGAEPSILKIKGSEIQQRVTELALEITGYAGFSSLGGPLPMESNAYPTGPGFGFGAGSEYFNMRKSTIYGGSNEIQRNIIAKTVLGL